MRHLMVLVALLAAWPSTSEAQDASGVVLRFAGRGGARARSIVIRAISDRVSLQGRAEVGDAARGLGADLDQPEGMRAVAEELGLDFFFTGRVRGRGGRARTLIHIHDALGNEVAFREAPRPQGRARLRRIGIAAQEALEQALQALAERRAAAAAQTPVIPEEPEEPWGDEEEEEEEEEEDEGSSSGAGLPLVRGLVGIQGRRRQAEVRLNDLGTRRYDSSLYLELALRLESFPLRGSGSAARGLYGEVDFQVSVGLSSQEQDTGGMAVGDEIKTTAWRTLLQLGYLYPIGGGCAPGDEDEGEETCRPPAALVGALVGFGLDTFSIDTNMTMPSSRYTFLRLGAVGAAYLAGELLRVRADLGYRLTFGVGDIATSFGADASAGGFDVGVGVDGQHSSGISYLLRFGFARYGLDFAGVAVDQEATSGSDSALTLMLMLGYSL